MKYVKKQESGRSMIEMVGVLTVMGLLTAGAFILIQAGMATQRRSRTMDDVSNIVATYRSLFAEYGKFDKVNGVSLASVHLPEHHPWGGDYEVVGGSAATNNPTSLIITMKDLPYQECVVLSARSWSGATVDDSGCTGELEAGEDELPKTADLVLTYQGF